MRQRLGIAQALLDAPELLILDEPSALTDIEVEGLVAIMKKLVSEGKSIIFISHKMREVLHISARITIQSEGEFVNPVDYNLCTMMDRGNQMSVRSRHKSQ